jgi:cytochrome c553
MPRCTSRSSSGRRAARAQYLGVAASVAAIWTGATPAAAQNVPDARSAGRDKFVQCASCHGADGRSTVVPQYPKIGGQTAEYVVIALKAYRDGRRLGTYAAMMTAVAQQLSDVDIANLAAYVESLDASH